MASASEYVLHSPQRNTLYWRRSSETGIHCTGEGVPKLVYFVLEKELLGMLCTGKGAPELVYFVLEKEPPEKYQHPDLSPIIIAAHRE